MYPDFIGIGAQKAGTTWLYHNLRVHPQIWIPRKEVHYFDQKINDTSASLRSRLFGRRLQDQRWRGQVKHWTMVHLKNRSLSGLIWIFKYYVRTPSDEWYASLFDGSEGRIAGEITPNYSVLDKETIAHVHELMPETKIIFLMRNPIERAWSQAVMHFDKEGRSVETVSEEKLRNFRSNQSRLLTDYLRTLENWGSFYPEEQIFVGFLEDIHFYPNRLLERLYRFLGADPSAEYQVIKRKIHSRAVETMPIRIASRLADSYREDIRRLSERFGGYASFWLYCAERLVEDPPAGESIPYPLWEASLWGDWLEACGEASPIGSPETEPQSGLLSAFS